MVRLMSVIRLQRRLIYEWLFLLEGLLGCPLLIVEVPRVLVLGLELCKSQSLSLHSPCIRNFSIIGDPWFLRLGKDY